MFRPLVRVLAIGLAMPVATACTQVNPLFVPISAGDETTTSTVATTDEPGLTADPDTGSESSTGSAHSTASDALPDTTTTATTNTTDPIETSTGEPPPDTSTGEPPPDTSTGEPPPDTSTGEPLPDEEVQLVVASLATCVLLPAFGLLYVGPFGCETLAEQNDKVEEIGVMILDKSFMPGGNRASRVYVRFEVPQAPADKALIGATLTVQLSAGLDAGAAWSGDLYLSEAFDANSLKAIAPAGTLLTIDPGPSVPDESSSWQIPIEKIVPNQPLYLGLGALGDDVVAFRSTRASVDDRPTLTLAYQ